MRPSISDAVLVQLIAVGDHSAYGELRRRHRLFVYTEAYAVLWDAAVTDLAVAEVFEEVWCSAARFRDTGSAQAWLSGITRTVAMRRR
jgi:DNA-directed RNA polymerase specialized sigma24 family protein